MNLVDVAKLTGYFSGSACYLGYGSSNNEWTGSSECSHHLVLLCFRMPLQLWLKFMSSITSIYLANLKQNNPTMHIFPLLLHYYIYHPYYFITSTATPLFPVLCHHSHYYPIIPSNTPIFLILLPLLRHYPQYYLIAPTTTPLLPILAYYFHYYSRKISLYIPGIKPYSPDQLQANAIT